MKQDVPKEDLNDIWLDLAAESSEEKDTSSSSEDEEEEQWVMPWVYMLA